MGGLAFAWADGSKLAGLAVRSDHASKHHHLSGGVCRPGPTSSISTESGHMLLAAPNTNLEIRCFRGGVSNLTDRMSSSMARCTTASLDVFMKAADDVQSAKRDRFETQ